jgi:hypothetical protein
MHAMGLPIEWRIPHSGTWFTFYSTQLYGCYRYEFRIKPP